MISRRLVFATMLLFFLPSFARGAAAAPSEIFYRAGDVQVEGDGPSSLHVGFGGFDMDGDASPAVRAEWHGGGKAGFLGPAVGLLANAEGGIFGYAGLFADLAWKRMILTPFWGAGAYEEGSGKDLGGTFQFRSAITLAYRLDERSHLGIHFAHISNADLHEENPGEQDLFLTFVRPF